MCPESVVTCRDTKAGGEVVGYCPKRCLELERNPDSLNEAIHRDADNESDIKPVDMFVPVLFCDGSLGDVRLLGIVLWISVWL